MRSSREGQGYEVRAQSRSGGGGGGGGVAGKVFIIIIVCVFIYFISAGAVGKWIAQNIVTPVLSLFEDNDSPGVINDAQATPSPSAVSTSQEKVNEKIVLPDLSVYALQTGVFAEQANADEAAAQAMQQGGAGYILTDSDGNMRVLLSAYKTEEEAKSVSENLKTTQNYETYEYVLSAKGVTFDITATQSNVDAIKDFFTSCETVHNQFYDMYIKFDKKEITADDVKTQISQMVNNTDPSIKSIKGMAQNGDAVLTNLMSFADGLENCLSMDLSGKSDVAISAQLKYNYIWVSDLYRKLIDGLK
jgi:hypothetical protein